MRIDEELMEIWPNEVCDNVTTATAHIWADNSVIKQLQVHSLNVTSIKAELMAIYTGLIPAIEIDNIHDITVITDSMAAAKKILESKVDPFQSMFIPLASAVKTSSAKIAEIKFTSGTALAKLNGLDTSALMTKSKQAHTSLHSPARSHIYSAKRKSMIIPLANGKHLLPTALKKATTS